jgi:hypothetical protein
LPALDSLSQAKACGYGKEQARESDFEQSPISRLDDRMSWLFRPGAVAFISGALVLVAGILLLWPLVEVGRGGHAILRPIPPGDEEIAWLNPATNAVAWERLVAAVHHLRTVRPDLEVELAAESSPFPSQTTQVPEFAVTALGRKSRLWFRWYKLTGNLGPREWVQAFLRDRRPPLAVIGGSSSDRARDLAGALAEEAFGQESPPLLLITNATADNVDEDKELIRIYPGRSFRFCFTDSQMADAVAQFIWSQDDLRPDAEPLYMALWDDDPYSEDLFKQFHRVLGPDGLYRTFHPAETLQEVVQDWAWTAARLATGGTPLGIELAGLRRGDTPPPAQFVRIPFSVGTFTQPNPWEVEAAKMILDELTQHPSQRRPLLVLPAAPQPARRLLRALLRTAPREARRLVVATGDAIDFNTIYRDRNLAWPIQDLAVPLVFFCHRNPVDPSGFDPREGSDPPDPMGRNCTSTHDLLLYRDIVESVVESVYANHGFAHTTEALSAGLRAHRGDGRRDRFDDKGNPLSGSGEFVVCLRPVRAADRVMPQAKLQVWNRAVGSDGARHWRRIPVGGHPELLMNYSSSTEN